MLKNTICSSLPRRRESRKARKYWIPAGVYPREGGGGNDSKDGEDGFFSNLLKRKL
jgi:hypothetical protein